MLPLQLKGNKMKQCECQWILKNQIASAIYAYNYDVESIKEETKDAIKECKLRNDDMYPKGYNGKTKSDNISELSLHQDESIDCFKENMQRDIKEAIDRYFRKTSTCSDWKCIKI